MAVLKILRFPDPRLRKKAVRVEQVDDSIRKLVADMLETMYDAYGIGLAATQVDIQKAVLVADVDRERAAGRNDPVCLINPEIIEAAWKYRIRRRMFIHSGVYGDGQTFGSDHSARAECRRTVVHIGGGRFAVYLYPARNGSFAGQVIH